MKGEKKGHHDLTLSFLRISPLLCLRGAAPQGRPCTWLRCPSRLLLSLIVAWWPSTSPPEIDFSRLLSGDANTPEQGRKNAALRFNHKSWHIGSILPGLKRCTKNHSRGLTLFSIQKNHRIGYTVSADFGNDLRNYTVETTKFWHKAFHHFIKQLKQWVMGVTIMSISSLRARLLCG